MRNIILSLIFIVSLTAFANKISIKPNTTSYEFELLIEQLQRQTLNEDIIQKLKIIDVNSSKLNKKNKLFFFKNSLYKNILKNSIFLKTRKDITLKEFIRTLNKYNEKKEDYTTFSNWIIESILVEYKDLEKATTPEEFRLIAKKPEINQAMELTSNLILDFLNLDPGEFLTKIDALAIHIIHALYNDALILGEALKIDIKSSEPSILFTKTDKKKTEQPKKAVQETSDNYMPEVDPSTAIDNLDIKENKKEWKPKN